MGRARGEGQVLPLVAIVVLTAGIAVVWVARIGEAAVVRARARTAADAAALAGAAEGRPAAAAAAAANGARLVAFRDDGAAVTVRVRIEGAEASARARRGGGPSVGPAP